MGKIKKGITKAAATALLCGAVLFATGTTCQAAGETYDTAMEAAYGDTFRSVYENRLAGSPLEAEAADGVDTATGHLMLSRTDLSLEGTGGMDFELNRYYDSNEANLGHATVEYIIYRGSGGGYPLGLLHSLRRLSKTHCRERRRFEKP